MFGVGASCTRRELDSRTAVRGLHARMASTRVFVTPQVHRWHHSGREVPERHTSTLVNYGVGGYVVWGYRLLPEPITCRCGTACPFSPTSSATRMASRTKGNYFKLLFLTRYLPKLSSRAKQ